MGRYRDPVSRSGSMRPPPGCRVRNLRFNVIVATLGLALLVPSLASAGSNSISLQDFGDCTFGPAQNCRFVTTNEEAFRAFARDLGVVMAPRGLMTAETLGQAGFAFQVDHTVSTVDSNAEHWVLASVDDDPSGTLNSTQFHIRKGLPFSLELGGIFTALWGSDLMAIGTELRWALHEDYYFPVPDLAFRGFVNTVLGDPQLSLTNTGFDVVLGLPIGVGNVMNITPYAGYNGTIVISASRLVDATPDDPTPPFTNVADPSLSNQPEFAFDVDNELVSQGIIGARFQATLLDITLQGTIGSDVQHYSFSLGLDF